MVRSDEGERLREGFDKHSRQLYTYVPAILVDVDENYRGIVRQYHYLGQKATDVPIKALYTGDGHGEKHALHLPEIGHMHCPQYPDEAVRDPSQEGEEPPWNRHHDFTDGTFVADVRQDDEAPVDGPLGEYRYLHESGAERKVTVDGEVIFLSSEGEKVRVGNGAIEATQTDGQHLLLDSQQALVEHVDGHRLKIDGAGLTGTHATGHEFSVRDSAVRLAFQRSDGQVVRLRVDTDAVSMTVPDEYNQYATDPESEIRVADDGTARLDGRAQLGDSDANRVDAAVENTDANDPHDYQPVDEPVAPILDPTDDSETQFDNPPTTDAVGPIDFGLYEARRFMPPRRAADPDVTVTDATQDAYIDVPDAFRQAGALPAGLLWYNATEDAMKRTGKGGTIVNLG